MRQPILDRTLRFLLLGAFALLVVAAVVGWVQARSHVDEPAALLVLVAAVALAAAGGLILHRTAIGRAAARDEIAACRVQLAGMQDKFGKFSQAQGRFVGNIAHEIKTPLAIALAEVDLLLRCFHDPVAVQSHAKSLMEEIRHLAALVDSFLRLARPFAQEDRSHHASVDIRDVVVEAVRRSQALVRKSEVHVVIELVEAPDAGGELDVLGDEVLLAAMIENLVRNALRFSPPGSKVDVRVHVRGPSILISVRDHGAGIAAEYVESVFEWFFRAPGVTLPSSGTGFGLAIAKRVAEHHGGQIALRNMKDGGCEFEVTLPRLPTGEQPSWEPQPADGRVSP